MKTRSNHISHRTQTNHRLGRSAIFAAILALTALFAAPAMAEQPTTATQTAVPEIQLQQGPGACIQVITYGKNPGTGECKQFATPCDVPNGWDSFSTLEECQQAGVAQQGNPNNCIQVITYGKNPGTGQCKEFPTPCDVPNGWESFFTLEDCQSASS